MYDNAIVAIIAAWFAKNQLQALRPWIISDRPHSFEFETKWARMPWLVPNLERPPIIEPAPADIAKSAIIINLTSAAGNTTHLTLNCVSGFSVTNLYNANVGPIGGQTPQPYIVSSSNTLGAHNMIYVRVAIPCHFITEARPIDARPVTAPSATTSAPAPPIKFAYFGPYSTETMCQMLWPVSTRQSTFQESARIAFQAVTTLDVRNTKYTTHEITTRMLQDMRISTHIDTLIKVLEHVRGFTKDERIKYMHTFLSNTYGHTTEAKHLEKFAVAHLLPTFFYDVEANSMEAARRFIEQKLARHGLAILCNLYYATQYARRLYIEERPNN